MLIAYNEGPHRRLPEKPEVLGANRLLVPLLGRHPSPSGEKMRLKYPQPQ